MLYAQSVLIYLVNHLIVTVVRASIRQKYYKHIYGGNTTWQKCIKRRVLRKRTFVYAIIVTLTVLYLIYI